MLACETYNRPEAADHTLRVHMVSVLVSDDSGFTGILREVRIRCLRTLIVGDEKGDGGAQEAGECGVIVARGGIGEGEISVKIVMNKP